MGHQDPIAEADAEITRVERANQTAFSLLMQLEHHRALPLLRTGRSTGRTEPWSHEARRDLGVLWELLVQHTAGLAAIRTIRATRNRLSAADLEAIRSICDGADSRALPDLIEEMIALHDDVRTVLDAVERVADELVPGLEECAARLAAAADRAARLGAGARAMTAGLATRLDELRTAVRHDPLTRCTGPGVDRDVVDRAAVDRGPVNALAADCARAGAELAALDELRVQFPTLLAGLDGVLRRLEECEWRAALGRAEAAVTVGQRPAQPTHRRRAAELRAALTRTRALAAEGDWVPVSRAVAELRTALPVALTVAVGAVEQARQPVRARSELQALLGLYRLKAAGLGPDAQRPLAPAYRRAGELVQNAAGDLTAARAAVESYRHLVNGTTAGRKGSASV